MSGCHCARQEVLWGSRGTAALIFIVGSRSKCVCMYVCTIIIAILSLLILHSINFFKNYNDCNRTNYVAGPFGAGILHLNFNTPCR